MDFYDGSDKPSDKLSSGGLPLKSLDPRGDGPDCQ
jgi:hypothetical protein